MTQKHPKIGHFRELYDDNPIYHPKTRSENSFKIKNKMQVKFIYTTQYGFENKPHSMATLYSTRN